MEKKIQTIMLIAAFWLLSLVVVAQCAIHETDLRHDSTPHLSPTSHYNTSLTGFESAFKRGVKTR